jgi:hypothetical protein
MHCKPGFEIKPAIIPNYVQSCSQSDIKNFNSSANIHNSHTFAAVLDFNTAIWILAKIMFKVETFSKS